MGLQQHEGSATQAQVRALVGALAKLELQLSQEQLEDLTMGLKLHAGSAARAQVRALVGALAKLELELSQEQLAALTSSCPPELGG
eukprot:gene13646-19529_t